MPTLRRFKYLIAFNKEANQFTLGFTPDKFYHQDIYLDKTFKRFSAGHFSVEQDGFNWVVASVSVYGRSEGFDLEPGRKDKRLIELLLQSENEGHHVDTFDASVVELVTLHRSFHELLKTSQPRV